MTVKTSLFNKGIYKSNIRRFAWGSILYFIALFLTTCLPIILVDYDTSTILDGYLIFPLVIATAVPTVVGLMVFRFIHSKKATVFIHSLPVSKEANYISTVLAALTLMALPVIATAALLACLTLAIDGAYYGLWECMVWMANNLFAMFIMFSCTAFVASVTGNSFAMVVLNVLIHTVLLIVAECTGFIAEEFIYGFEARSGIIGAIEEGNFPSRIFLNAFSEDISFKSYIIPVIAAIIFYILAFVLYKKRHNETAEDIAGFRCLNYILKYFLTLLVALVVFSGFASSYNYDAVMAWITVAILSVVTYFGVEMLLRKTFRVWGSYRGFIACGGFFVAFILIITKTSFFGYETRVPDINEVESISVCEAYRCIGNTISNQHNGIYDHYENCDLFFDDKEIIEKGIKIHKERIKEGENDQKEYSNLTEIRYKLKNGKTMSRRYYMTDNEAFELMDKLYANEKYKNAYELFLRDDITVKSAYIYYEENKTITPIEDFARCMREDIKQLSYSDIRSRWNSFGIEVEYEVDLGEGEKYRAHSWEEISPRYKNTLEWLKENGYEVNFD